MPDTTASDILKNSVTQNDYQSGAGLGGAFFLTVPHLWSTGALPPTLANQDLKDTDRILTSTPEFEAMWAAAIFIAKTKIASLSWEIEGDIPLRVKRAQELLHASDLGRGWVSFIHKHLQDFLCTNNGAFIEIVRAGGRSMNSQIISLVPLDSLRCQRTSDPERPVIYQDLKGALHEMRDYEVIELVDEPSPRANLLGMGRCAAARAYPSIYSLYSVETYMSEKVSGRRPLAINMVSGLNTAQLQQVLETAQSQADARGVISYMGAIIATIPGESAPGLVTIPLAEIPDGFNRKEELDHALLSYADNIGLDPQDLQPISNQQLGAGAQSVVLAEKAKGRGLAAWRQQITHALDNWVLPDMTTMVFVEKDWRDKKLNAEYNAAVEAYTSDAVKNSIITAAQGLQALVDENVFPDEFLPTDITPDTTLADDEKPETESVETPVPVPAAAPIISPVVPEVKEKTPAELIEQEADHAIGLVERIRRRLAPKKEKAVESVISDVKPAVIDAPTGITINFPPGLIQLTQPAPNIKVTTPPVTVEAAQITVNVPERKGEFRVERDNYGNVMGIKEE